MDTIVKENLISFKDLEKKYLIMFANWVVNLLKYC